MDILNFISWVKRGDYKATLPTDTTNLIAIGAKDPKRDDTYRPIAVNAENLQPLYNKGTVTQITSATTGVTLNTHSGVITTVAQTLAADANAEFVFTNSKLKSTSVVLLQAQYAGAGVVSLETRTLGDGTMRIRVDNVGTSALDAVVAIHFMVII